MPTASPRKNKYAVALGKRGGSVKSSLKAKTARMNGMHNLPDDITGQRFERWTVVSYVGKSMWHCKCDCGKEADIRGTTLRNGMSKSCGCLRNENTKAMFTTHGHSRSKTNFIWRNMLDRCRNPKARAYRDYGARGIKVCRRWSKFENFLADMGEKPPGMSLDRKRNNGNYEPGNCHWTTRKIQQNNRRNSLRVKIDGITDTIGNHATRTGIKYQTLYQRHRQ